MSAKLMGEVWELDLPQKHAWVLMSLCDHAEHDGTKVFPGNGYTAWKTGFSESTIKRTLRELRDEYDLIELVEDGGGKRAAEWRVRVENFDAHRKDPMPGRGRPKADEKPRSENPGQSEPRSGKEKPRSHSRARDDRNRPVETSSSPTEESADSTPGQYCQYLREELKDADVPFLRGRENRYGKEFKQLIQKSVSDIVLFKVCDRIVERWLDDDHAKLTAEQAMGDVVNGRPPTHVVRLSDHRGKKPTQSYNGLFERDKANG